MFNEGGFNPEDKEVEAKKTIEVWVLDDNEALTESQLRGWETMVSKDFGFLSYATAKEALTVIEQKLQNNESLPNIIFVDGNLDKDEGELKDGANFIIKIRRLDIPQPILIAHSNSKSANERMMSAGADLIMTKGNKTLRDYLKFFQSIESNPIEQ